MANLGEAFAMVRGALGTLNRMSGVKILNGQLDGRPIALAIIEEAQFGEDDQGNTTLQGSSDEPQSAQ